MKSLEKLGGLQHVKVVPRKCCCWGTPIGDKLLILADSLDKDGNTLLAQTESKGDSSAPTESEKGGSGTSALMKVALQYQW